MTRALAAAGLAVVATLGAGASAGTAQAAEGASVCYTPHVQDVGWKSEVCNGAWAGSIGEARNLEALRVRINYGSLCMKAHRANYGWDSTYQCANPSHDIQIGTERMNTPIEAISYYYCPDSRLGGQGNIYAEGWLRNVGGVSSSPSPFATYRSGCKDEGIVGTVGKAIPMEAVKFSWSL
ncbi:hypothetical protein ACFYU9_08420 [Streptomyces sp. NPDC004327]|uniref:hypothetical protein n=1 Tax=unclassified Streptomyces TaxID=2593676 RepID=UPI0036921E33